MSKLFGNKAAGAGLEGLVPPSGAVDPNSLRAATKKTAPGTVPSGVYPEREYKRRFQLWLHPSALQLVEDWYPRDNCSSKSEFIEKAILFYTGYLASNGSHDYIARNITSTLQGMLSESETRICRMLFKLTVELAVAMNVIAATNHISQQQLRELRATCVSEVKRTNGSYNLQDALEMQRR